MQWYKAYFILILVLLNTAGYSQYITYRSDVKPIIEKHCTGCHAKGEIGPMPLTSYDEVATYGKKIKYVTGSRIMPPWHADPSFRHFKNERVLTDEEIKSISDWVDGNMKKGAEPYGQIISSTVGVTVLPRDPDLIIFMHELSGQSGIDNDQKHQAFKFPTELYEDKWIEGIEFVPGNTKAIRHATVYVSDPGNNNSLIKWDSLHGYFSFGETGKGLYQPLWYTWSPKQDATFYKEGMGKFLPAGGELTINIYYGQNETPAHDLSEVRLWFSENEVSSHIRTSALINPSTITNDPFYIAPNEEKIFHAQYVLPQDIHLISITPQANKLCRSWEIFAKVPGLLLPLNLLKINDWKFNWIQTYHIESPMTLPAGTVIHAMAKYENTFANPVPEKSSAHLLSESFYVHFEYF